MKQNEIKTCEEYVLNELNKANEKVVALKNENKELQGDLDTLSSKYQTLYELVKELLVNSRVKVEDDIVSVYLSTGYVGCYIKNSAIKDDSQDATLKALTTLIDMFNSIPQRQGE